jgi:hypothetical protein
MTLGTIQEFDFATNLPEALLWQFDDATRLKTLISEKQAWYDRAQRDFWTDWYRDVFDLRTANDFGLSVWSIILNFPLVANATPSEDRPVFGFGEENLNFYESNFGRDSGGAISLDTEQKRLILQLRYFQLITTGCVPEINEFMKHIFGNEGTVYVLDGLDMTAEYVFHFFPNSRILFVLENFDVLPRPAGVRLRVLITPGDSFGFDPYYLNFNNSNFSD